MTENGNTKKKNRKNEKKRDREENDKRTTRDSKHKHTKSKQPTKANNSKAPVYPLTRGQLPCLERNSIRCRQTLQEFILINLLLCYAFFFLLFPPFIFLSLFIVLFLLFIFLFPLSYCYFSYFSFICTVFCRPPLSFFFAPPPPFPLPSPPPYFLHLVFRPISFACIFFLIPLVHIPVTQLIYFIDNLSQLIIAVTLSCSFLFILSLSIYSSVFLLFSISLFIFLQQRKQVMVKKFQWRLSNSVREVFIYSFKFCSHLVSSYLQLPRIDLICSAFSLFHIQLFSSLLSS